LELRLTAKMIPSIDSLVKEVWCIIRIDRMGVKMIRDCNHHSSNLLSHKVGLHWDGNWRSYKHFTAHWISRSRSCVFKVEGSLSAIV
jgi:hypothetical protein